MRTTPAASRPDADLGVYASASGDPADRLPLLDLRTRLVLLLLCLLFVGLVFLGLQSAGI